MSSEDEMELFEPEVVLPVQMSWGAPCDGGTSGPRALMLAILEDARLCIERGRRRRHRHNRQLTEAEAWVRCDSREWLFAFASICDVLGLDADAVRVRLLTDAEHPAGRGWATRAHEIPTRSRAVALLRQPRARLRGSMAASGARVPLVVRGRRSASVVPVPAQDATSEGRRVVGGPN